jgi:hypothetical protein
MEWNDKEYKRMSDKEKIEAQRSREQSNNMLRSAYYTNENYFENDRMLVAEGCYSHS